MMDSEVRSELFIVGFRDVYRRLQDGTRLLGSLAVTSQHRIIFSTEAEEEIYLREGAEFRCHASKPWVQLRLPEALNYGEASPSHEIIDETALPPKSEPLSKLPSVTFEFDSAALAAAPASQPWLVDEEPLREPVLLFKAFLSFLKGSLKFARALAGSDTLSTGQQHSVKTSLRPVATFDASVVKTLADYTTQLRVQSQAGSPRRKLWCAADGEEAFQSEAKELLKDQHGATKALEFLIDGGYLNETEHSQFWEIHRPTLVALRSQVEGAASDSKFWAKLPDNLVARLKATSAKASRATDDSGASESLLKARLIAHLRSPEDGDEGEANIASDEEHFLKDMLYEFPRLQLHYDKLVPSEMDRLEYYGRLIHSHFFNQLFVFDRATDVPEDVDDGFNLRNFQSLDAWNWDERFDEQVKGKPATQLMPVLDRVAISALVEPKDNLILADLESETRQGHGTSLGEGSIRNSGVTDTRRGYQRNSDNFRIAYQETHSGLGAFFARLNRNTARILGGGEFTSGEEKSVDLLGEILTDSALTDEKREVLDQCIREHGINNLTLRTSEKRKMFLQDQLRVDEHDLPTTEVAGGVSVNVEAIRLKTSRAPRGKNLTATGEGLMLGRSCPTNRESVELVVATRSEVEQFKHRMWWGDQEVKGPFGGESGLFSEQHFLALSTTQIEQLNGGKATMASADVQKHARQSLARRMKQKYAGDKKQVDLNKVYSNPSQAMTAEGKPEEPQVSLRSILDNYAGLQDKVCNVLRVIWDTKTAVATAEAIDKLRAASKALDMEIKSHLEEAAQLTQQLPQAHRSIVVPHSLFRPLQDMVSQVKEQLDSK